VTHHAEPRLYNILIAEDNLGHQRLTEYALRKKGTPVRCVVVHDGQEVLDYLYRHPPFDDAARAPRPDLILLDLNLPKRDGREVLGIIGGDPSLRLIPVVIVSTSDREEDVRYALDNGARAYISKSRGFDRFTEEISEVVKYAST
jgi:chemotaxis family two-component system response regulator Rcp1